MVKGVWQFDRCRMNVEDGQRPSTSADPVQNIGAAVQAARHVKNVQLELRFNISWGTLLIKFSATGKFAPGVFLVIWLKKTNKTRMASSPMLLQRYEEHGEAFLRIIVTEDDLVLPLHHREQGCLDDLKASSISSQKEVQDSAVSRESDGSCFLGCLCIGTCERHGAINQQWHIRTLRYHKPAMAHTDITVP